MRRLPAVAVLLTASLLLPGVSSAATPPKTGAYVGTTSEKGSVAFTVSKSAATVQSFTAQLGYNGKCGQGGGPGFEISIPSMKLSKAGGFTATTTGVAGKTKGTIKIAGKLSRTTARGTIVEPIPWFKCQAPNQKINPYSETFTAKTH